MSTPQLNLLVVYCSNLITSLEYYESLGLQFVKEKHGKGPVHWSTQIGECIFELYPNNHEAKPRPMRFGLSLNEKDLRVDLTANDPEKPLIVRDPDGNYIHISVTTSQSD